MQPAKEPRPFCPAWRLVIGPVSEQGSGLLPPRVSQQLGLIDQFSILVGDWKAIVLPKLGEIALDSRLVKSIAKQEMRLLWFRRMEAEIGTHDKNSAAAECLWYGFGIEWADGRCGYRLYQDGRVEEGFNA